MNGRTMEVRGVLHNADPDSRGAARVRNRRRNPLIVFENVSHAEAEQLIRGEYEIEPDVSGRKMLRITPPPPPNPILRRELPGFGGPPPPSPPSAGGPKNERCEIDDLLMAKA